MTPEELKAKLDSYGFPDDQKAQIWDSVTGSGTPAELKQKLDALPLDNNQKSDLWDLAISKANLPTPSGGGIIKDAANAAWNFGKGAAEVLNPLPLGKGLATHPIDTIKNIVLSQGPILDRAKASFEAGDYESGVKHFIHYLIPLLGPALDEAGMKIAQGDTAEGLGMTAGIALPFVKTGIPVAEKVGGVLEKSAAKNYRDVLLPSSKKMVPEAEETAVELAKEKPIAINRESLMRKAAQKKEEIGPQAGIAYEGKPRLDPTEILDSLEQLKQKNTIARGSTTVVNEPLHKAISKIQDNIIDMTGPDSKINPVSLDDYRDKLFKGLVDPGGNLQQVSPQSIKAMQKGSANAIRQVLDSEHPDAKAINDTYHLWASTYKFLEETRRAQIASKSGLVTGSSKGFGALVEKNIPKPLRAIPQKILGYFDSVNWNTVAGATKQTIAESLASGDMQTPLLIIKGILKGAVGSRGITSEEPGKSSVSESEE